MKPEPLPLGLRASMVLVLAFAFVVGWQEADYQDGRGFVSGDHPYLTAFFCRALAFVCAVGAVGTLVRSPIPQAGGGCIGGIAAIVVLGNHSTVVAQYGRVPTIVLVVALIVYLAYAVRSIPDSTPGLPLAEASDPQDSAEDGEAPQPDAVDVPGEPGSLSD